MARSRRKYKNSRPKVRVGLPKKKPGVFKPAVDIPPALAAAAAAAGEKREWDDKGTVIRNYRSFGVVANPNVLGVRARTAHIIQSSSLQVPDREAPPVSEFDPIDSGSDLESDDLKSALRKKRRDGKTAPLPPLTTMQRVYIGRLIEKYGDDYQAMFMDTKLNSMQHSVATLKKLCQRFYVQGKHFITS
ncbi:nucleolar protein 16 [Cocos nucifera]|uniref:Nucleolar protein 16 n=1 Tax=Cocos nucifera TaxID=13894 RepID=A0A8K0I795_COCNU|nr:nucleolar protein 16 [Cocos nucifera]